MRSPPPPPAPPGDSLRSSSPSAVAVDSPARASEYTPPTLKRPNLRSTQRKTPLELALLAVTATPPLVLRLLLLVLAVVTVSKRSAFDPGVGRTASPVMGLNAGLTCAGVWWPWLRQAMKFGAQLEAPPGRPTADRNMVFPRVLFLSVFFFLN